MTGRAGVEAADAAGVEAADAAAARVRVDAEDARVTRVAAGGGPTGCRGGGPAGCRGSEEAAVDAVRGGPLDRRGGEEAGAGAGWCDVDPSLAADAAVGREAARGGVSQMSVKRKSKRRGDEGIGESGT